MNLGLFYWRQNDLPKAREIFEQAVALSSDLAMPRDESALLRANLAGVLLNMAEEGPKAKRAEFLEPATTHLKMAESIAGGLQGGGDRKVVFEIRKAWMTLHVAAGDHVKALTAAIEAVPMIETGSGLEPSTVGHFYRVYADAAGLANDRKLALELRIASAYWMLRAMEQEDIDVELERLAEQFKTRPS